MRVTSCSTASSSSPSGGRMRPSCCSTDSSPSICHRWCAHPRQGSAPAVIESQLVALRFWSRFDSGATSSAAYRATKKLRRPERGRCRSGAGWCAADARAHGVGGDGLDGCEGRQGGEADAEPSLRVLTVRSNVRSRGTVCVGPLTHRSMAAAVRLRRCASCLSSSA